MALHVRDAGRTVKPVVVATLIVAASAGQAQPAMAAAGQDANGSDRRSVVRFLDDVLPPGASGTLVAVRDGRTVLCRGWGLANRAAHVPARCDTVYDVMSMTKQFTAAAILKLQMAGKLAVTDPIGKFFPSVPQDKATITVRQLLTHTAGLTESLGDDYEPRSRASMVAAALGSTLVSAPGAEHHYSNLGYSLLAAIVEKASGQSYERFLARSMFGPAGMRSTGYRLPGWRRGRVAIEYDGRGRPQGRPFDHPWASDGPYWNLRGNGGLLSTARDMARWHRALERGTVLDRQATRALFTPRVREQPGGTSYYGYGWVLQDSPLGRIAWHDGGNGWSYGELTRIARQRVMVFWVANQSISRARRWNLEALGPRLTRGVIKRLGAVRADAE